MRITRTTTLAPDDPLRPAEVKGDDDAVYVLFDADIRQRPVATWSDGRHPWGLYVVRDGTDQPWRIGASGLG